MTECIIKQAYTIGEIQANNKNNISMEDIQSCYADFFIELCNKIRSTVQKKQQNEKGKFSNVEVFQKLHQDEIIYDAIKEVLFDYNISPYSLATDIELSVQTSFILGYLDHQHIFEKKSLEFKLCARGGPQLISDWIYSLLQVNGNDITPFAMTQDELLREYFKLETGYSVRAIFIREDTDLAEDQWVTKRNRYGKLYRFEIKDDTAYGDKEVLGGSYEFVKHFADSKTYEVHHLIPAKLLELTKILGYLDGPCIRMEKEDHAKTSSYKNNRMLHEKYFRKQKIYLETNNIRAAVEMEIADIQDKFGSKYDDAIREVRKYVAKLEKQLKK